VATQHAAVINDLRFADGTLIRETTRRDVPLARVRRQLLERDPVQLLHAHVTNCNALWSTHNVP
jgi:hypothetical protein